MSDFLDLIFKGTSLGLEERIIEIEYDFLDEDFNEMLQKLESRNVIKFKINIPYAGTHLPFVTQISICKPYSPPVLKFRGSFSPSLHSIGNWNPHDSNSFLSIIQEIRENYKQYNAIQLEEFSEIYKEYLNFIEKEPNDIEVMVYPNRNIVFMIRLNVDILHIPQFRTDNRLLLEAFFRNGNINDVRLTVYICDTLSQVLSMSDFNIPVPSNIICCKHLIEQKFNSEILKYFPKPPISDIHLDKVNSCKKEPHSSIPETPTKLLMNLICNFLDLIGSGLCLGIENKTVDIQVVGLTELSHNTKYLRINFIPHEVEDTVVAFLVTVPYARNSLVFIIELQLSDPNYPPNVIYYSGSYKRRLENLVSLHEWNIKNPDSLINITKEVREKYKSHFVNQLQKKRPRLHKEYMRFVKENISDDIEVFIQGEDVLFLMHLRFGISHIVEQEGDDRILFKIMFREGSHSDYSISLITSGVWSRILRLISLPLTTEGSLNHLIRYKFYLEQKLNEKILRLFKPIIDSQISSQNLCSIGVRPEEFVTSHPIYLSRFLEAVSSGICLGVENVNIHIKEMDSCKPHPTICRETRLLSSNTVPDKRVIYTVLLPYAETELEFSFTLDVLNPDTSPEFIFDNHSFKPVISTLHSQHNWKSNNPDGLLSVIREIREQYKEHFVCKLQEFPSIYQEYKNFIAAATPDNIEVYVTEEQNCIFLIRLTTETSHIPKLKDGRILLHIQFGKGDICAMKMRIIADDNFDGLLKLIEFSVPELHRAVESTATAEQPGFRNVLSHKFLIEQQLNREILKIFPKQY